MVTMKDDNLESGLLPKYEKSYSSDEINDDDDSRITASLVFSTFVAVCGSFCIGSAVAYTSPAHSGITEDLGLTIAQYSVFGSIMTFGGMIGAVFSGKIADLVGRRHTMWFSEVFCIIGWIGVTFAQGFWLLDAGRLFLGIGIGLLSYVIPVYIAEITPKQTRGAFIFSNQLLQNCGTSFFYIIGNFIHWRTLAFLGLIPCFVQVIGLFFVPESPRWLGKHGKEKECKNALQSLRGKDADVSREASDIKDISEAEQNSNCGLRYLFQRKYAHSLIVGVGLMVIQQFSGSSAICYYASSIFDRAGFPSSIGTTILAIVMVPKSMIGLILVDKLGRRPLLMASASAMCVCSLILVTAFSFQELHILDELIPIFAFIGVVGFVTTFALGMGGLPWIIMSEIFPMNLKVSAGSIVTLANWSTGLIGTYSFNFLMEWSPLGTFFISAGVSASAILFTWSLVPETKGRTLEEIQASFSQFS